ncbi:MAG: hypothetical protein KC516_03480 [Nanoarchaeota archaeon]|nr:hypothetical protein [Nanoarchaeota archaeon]
MKGLEVKVGDKAKKILKEGVNFVPVVGLFTSLSKTMKDQEYIVHPMIPIYGLYHVGVLALLNYLFN